MFSRDNCLLLEIAYLDQTTERPFGRVVPIDNFILECSIVEDTLCPVIEKNLLSRTAASCLPLEDLSQAAILRCGTL